MGCNSDDLQHYSQMRFNYECSLDPLPRCLLKESLLGPLPSTGLVMVAYHHSCLMIYFLFLFLWNVPFWSVSWFKSDLRKLFGLWPVSLLLSGIGLYHPCYRVHRFWRKSDSWESIIRQNADYCTHRCLKNCRKCFSRMRYL